MSAIELRPGEKRTGRLEDVVDSAQFLVLSLELPEALAAAGIDLLALDPFEQGLRHAANLGADRLHRRPQRGGSRPAAPSPRARPARALHQQIRQRVSFLSDNPNLVRPGRIDGTRELVMGDSPYLLPYRARDDRIEILAVYHGARKWPEIFL